MLEDYVDKSHCQEETLRDFLESQTSGRTHSMKAVLSCQSFSHSESEPQCRAIRLSSIFTFCATVSLFCCYPLDLKFCLSLLTRSLRVLFMFLFVLPFFLYLHLRSFFTFLRLYLRSHFISLLVSAPDPHPTLALPRPRPSRRHTWPGRTSM
eukprot:754369-Hanusia_phi.AAC.2